MGRKMAKLDWHRSVCLACSNGQFQLTVIHLGAACHQFLIRFYGTHLRLQLFSLPLQEVLESKKSDFSLNLEAFWVCYSSALHMLRLVNQYSERLYFAQDSIHVMTAYSAAFLIKVCRDSVVNNFCCRILTV